MKRYTHAWLAFMAIERVEKAQFSTVSPTDNHIGLALFMLSHYIADAHMPFHCDSRAFSANEGIHSHPEGSWEKEISSHYCLDRDNSRFFYDPYGYPLLNPESAQSYQHSLLKKVKETLDEKTFPLSWGSGNNNVWDFMSSVCQHSYLLSHTFIPTHYNHQQVTRENYCSLGSLSYERTSIIALSDAIDSIALVWFRIWRKYLRWEKEKKEL